MSVVAEAKFAYSCTRCHKTLVADSDDSGCEKPCAFCGQVLVVPEPYDRAYDTSPPSVARGYSESSSRSSNLELINASRTKRLLASTFDHFLMAVALVAGVGVFLTLMSLGLIDKEALAEEKLNMATINANLAVYLPLLGLLIVQWNLIATTGQTFGKKIFNLRIVTADGSLPGFVRGVLLRNWLRFALCFIPLFGPIDYLVVFGESRRCIHDFLAGTFVVECG